MASVRERASKEGETAWAVLFRDGKRQRSKTFKTEKKARDFASLVDILGIKKALETIEDASVMSITVDELAEQFFAWKAPNIEARTLTDYKRDYKKWIEPTFGNRACATIDERAVQRWVDKISADLSPKSVADKHMILGSMFKWGSARTRRIVDYNPCTETSLPKRGRHSVKGATLAEWKALQVAGREIEPDATDLMEFIAATGWRWSEAAALVVRNVDDWEETDGRTVMRATVARVFRRDGSYKQVVAEDDAKSQAGLRSVKIPASAAKIVRRRMVGLGPDDLIFTNAAGRKWYQQNFLSRTWRRIEKEAGLDRHLTPHAIRHLHVALLDRSGASLPEMQRRLGHEDIQTTINVYGGMIDDISDDVLDKLDALLTGEAPGADVVPGEVVGQVLGELD